mmetsp:Transcript_37080/g.93540  ORF Transcript_37080/g.93540 Transcript_37080/m.93540 type:complete len:237 (+) Transcript_37080:397-1107(+)
MLLSTLPVAIMHSLYLHQSAVSTSNACAASVSVGCGCLRSHRRTLVSPLALMNTSPCCGLHATWYTQYVCPVNVRSAVGCPSDQSLMVSSQEEDRNRSRWCTFQLRLQHSCRCSLNCLIGLAVGGAARSYTLMLPSPLDASSTLSCASLQQQSYSPSTVSKAAISNGCPLGAISYTCCLPLPMMPKFCAVDTANLFSINGLNLTLYALKVVLQRGILSVSQMIASMLAEQGLLHPS